MIPFEYPSFSLKLIQLSKYIHDLKVQPKKLFSEATHLISTVPKSFKWRSSMT